LGNTQNIWSNSMYKEEFDEKWPPWWERLDEHSGGARKPTPSSVGQSAPEVSNRRRFAPKANGSCRSQDYSGETEGFSPRSVHNSVKIRVSKKIGKIIRGIPGRHLQKGLEYLVEEVGQYRVVYKSFEEKMVRRFYFVGTHDEYMKWLGLRK